MHYLIVPGYGDSGPDHWQTLWEKILRDTSRVVQKDWFNPSREEWVESLDGCVRDLKIPTVIVAHSLGVVTTVHWLLKSRAMGSLPRTVKGLFLVAPADADAVPLAKDFAPVPLQKLPLPSCVVASENDQYVTIERARVFAESWGSVFYDVGALGHINSESRLENWEQGMKLLEAFEKGANLQ